jgi:hypothetical protein
MSIKDEVEALKALVTKIIPERGVYNPGTSPEWARRKALAHWAYEIHQRNAARRGKPQPPGVS